MKQSWSTLEFLGAAICVAAVAFFAGYQIGKSPVAASTGSGPTEAFPTDPKGAVETYAAAVARWKGPFLDSLDQLDARNKLEAKRGGLTKLGGGAFDAVVAFLGVPGKAQSDGLAVPIERGSLANDPVVREELIKVLPMLDATKAVHELAARLANDSESERVRATAAGELSHLDRTVAVPALIEALDVATEHAWTGSRAILDALTLQGGAAAEAAVLQAFTKPTASQELRIASAGALGVMRAKGAVPVLENTVVHEDRDHYVRREAVRSLLRIDPERARELVDEQIPRESDAAFKEFLKDVAKQFALGKPK